MPVLSGPYLPFMRRDYIAVKWDGENLSPATDEEQNLEQLHYLTNPKPRCNCPQRHYHDGWHHKGCNLREPKQ